MQTYFLGLFAVQVVLLTTGIAFLAAVMQIAAARFSPAVVSGMMRDRLIQVSLAGLGGLFVVLAVGCLVVSLPPPRPQLSFMSAGTERVTAGIAALVIVGLSAGLAILLLSRAVSCLDPQRLRSTLLGTLTRKRVLKAARATQRTHEPPSPPRMAVGPDGLQAIRRPKERRAPSGPKRYLAPLYEVVRVAARDGDVTSASETIESVVREIAPWFSKEGRYGEDEALIKHTIRDFLEPVGEMVAQLGNSGLLREYLDDVLWFARFVAALQSRLAEPLSFLISQLAVDRISAGDDASSAMLVATFFDAIRTRQGLVDRRISKAAERVGFSATRLPALEPAAWAHLDRRAEPACSATSLAVGAGFARLAAESNPFQCLLPLQRIVSFYVRTLREGSDTDQLEVPLVLLAESLVSASVEALAASEDHSIPFRSLELLGNASKAGGPARRLAAIAAGGCVRMAGRLIVLEGPRLDDEIARCMGVLNALPSSARRAGALHALAEDTVKDAELEARWAFVEPARSTLGRGFPRRTSTALS